MKITFEKLADKGIQCTALKGLKGVVINILVNIEGCENVERVAKVNIPRDGCITSEDREKVRATNYTVDMDHRHDAVPGPIDIRLDNPHPVVWVGLVE